MDWQEHYAAKRMTAADAVERVPRGKNIFIGSGAAEPVKLVEELVAQSLRFADNTIVHILTLGPAPYVKPEHENRFRHNAFFIGPNVREAVHEGRADYTPIFLSQIPSMIRSRRVPVDVAFIQTSPPDSFGFVNLGVSVDVVLSAVECASLVIAEINPEMPVIHGAGFVPMDQIDGWVQGENTLPDLKREPLDEISLEIGRNVASLVDDGSTIQVGIGQIPDASLKALENKKDLGVWSEMFSDGVIDLIENGNITGRYKTIHPNKVSASFAFGSNHLYEYVDRNPTFTFHPSDFINDPTRVARQHKMVAINGALQIDLTGQVCADSIGTKFYSGIGGQVDFIRGASMSPGGKPILALPSTAKNGQLSRIVASLDPGAGVVTSRGDVEYVVTEYGVADLKGRSIRDRAMALISIAHPSYRAELLDAGKERHYVFPDQITSEYGYPRKYEKRIEIEGLPPVLMRPIRVTDEAKMSRLFYSLSDVTVYRRWHQGLKQLSHSDILRLLEVDYTKNMAIVMEAELDHEESKIIGVGRYHTDPATNYAETAFVILDEWQGHSLGTILLDHLIQIARENGIAGFTADVLAENRAMRHVFHKSGLEIQSQLHGGVYSLAMDLSPAKQKRKSSRKKKTPKRKS
ncbi:MAG: GNAT family N-acetyltransferase [Deltaproteobacteria bacterium]|jgi:acyl-CoA hydrolase/GNAT superfamily N-acetyltransferase|nr:GNAT family N-acetyltransferase [Deltaproteobacteria bacterium]MBW2541227.1 GNAT family N-acetyltransferase [Deltaproteobacteria bacterium]